MNAPIDRSVHKMDSTESMKQNERFSPIPFKKPVSPPMSPPPLELPPVVGPSTSPGVSVGMLGWPGRDESVGISGSMSPPRQSSMEVEKVLKNFEEVEKALQKSPYIIPQDLYLNQGRVESQTKTMEENLEEDLENVRDQVVEEQEEVASGTDNKDDGNDLTEALRELEEQLGLEDIPDTGLRGENTLDESDLLGGSQWSMVNQDQAPLDEIMENYSGGEEVNTAASSPFVERTKVETEELEADPPPSFSIQPTPPESRLETRNDEPDNEKSESEEDPLLSSTALLTPVAEPKISRMSSIQRRGQEYLNMFLARRQRHIQERETETEAEATVPTFALTSAPSFDFVEPPRRRIWPVTIILTILLTLSLVLNVFQWREYTLLRTAKEDRWEEIMTPGKVGETFEIFTTPSRPSSWDWWNGIRERNELILPTQIPQSLSLPEEWKVFGRRLSFGARGKREKLLRLEQEFVGICWRGISFLEEMWERYRRR